MKILLLYSKSLNYWISTQIFIGDEFNNMSNSESDDGINRYAVVDLPNDLYDEYLSIKNSLSNGNDCAIIRNELGFSCKVITQSEQEEVFQATKFAEAKEDKIANINLLFTKSKKVTIENGNTLVVNADTKTRNFFLQNIQEAVTCNEEYLSKVLYYHQPEEKNYYVNLVAYLWRYVFKDYWISRQINKRVYDFAINNIKNAKTLNQLNNINCIFENPDGIVINVNKHVEKLLKEKDKHPQYILDLLVQSKDADGVVHLVKVAP